MTIVKSTASFFSISKTIILEDFKRLWGISLLSFLTYFLTGTFSIIMHYDELNQYGDLVHNVLINNQEFYILLLLAVPIAVSAILFRYIQTVSSTAVIHAMPFKRKTLFNSHFLSGMLIILIPILLNGLILLLISKPVMSSVNNGPNPISVTLDVFSRTEILAWMGQSILTVITLFSIGIFSAVISGTSLLQVLFSMGFVFLLPALEMIFIYYCQIFVYGFEMTRQLRTVVYKSSPYLNILSNREFDPVTVIYYVSSFIAIIAVSYFLYKNRPLEKATDSITYNLLKPVFKFLAAFCGMSVLGLYFMQFGKTKIIMYVGFFLGALLTYIIAEMIIKKTIWVFRNMKGFLIYLVVAVLFFISLSIDITGYEKRIPNLDQIEAVSLDHYDYENTNDTMDFLKDPQNIQSLLNLHKYMIENKKTFKKTPSNLKTQDCRNISIGYKLKNGHIIWRRYLLDSDLWIANQNIRNIYESKEQKRNSNSIFKIKPTDIGVVTITPPYSVPKSVIVSDKDEISSLVHSLKNDILNEKFDSITSSKLPVANIQITLKDFSYKKLYPNNDSYQNFYQDNSYSIKKSFPLTVEWLKLHGYYDKIKVTSNDIQYVTVEKVAASSNPPNRYYDSNQPIPAATKARMVIQDKDQVQYILDNFDNSINYRKDIYYVSLFTGNTFIDGSFTKDNAPQFISSYFQK